jgi:hypothetical protein
MQAPEYLEDPLAELDKLIPDVLGGWINDVEHIDEFRAMRFSSITEKDLYLFLLSTNVVYNKQSTFSASNELMIADILKTMIARRDDGLIRLSHYSLCKGFDFQYQRDNPYPHMFTSVAQKLMSNTIVRRAMSCDPDVIYIGGSSKPVKNENNRDTQKSSWVTPNQDQLKPFFIIANDLISAVISKAKSDDSILSALVKSNEKGGYLDQNDLFVKLKFHRISESKFLKYASLSSRRNHLDQGFDI